MSFLVTDKKFYKTFIKISAALALQQLLNYCVNLADNAMLGAYNEVSMSGSALVSQIHYILQLMINGIGTGIVMIGSRYWGMKKPEQIRSFIGMGWKFAVALGAIFTIATMTASNTILSFFSNDPAVLAQGRQYLVLMSWTFVLFPISYCLMWGLRSVETTFIGPVLSGLSLILNICLNYIFIFGKLGAPEMGVTGAALATLISRIVEVLIMLVYVFLGDKKLRLRLGDLLRFDFTNIGLYLKAALPVTGTLLSFALGVSAQTAILGHFSSAALAANSIMSIVWQITGVVGMTCGSASAIVIGKAIGEGKKDMINAYSKTLQLMYILIGVVSAGILFALRHFILGFYELTPETMELARQMILALCFIVLATCYQYPVSSGIILGGGNSKYSFIVDSFAMWIIALPLAWISAYILRWPPLLTFCILRSDQFIKVLINGYWVNKRQWYRQLINNGDDNTEA
jgi:putative MATE family efflux protein